MNQNQSFDKSLSRLEEIVKILEGGETSLEEAMTLFEEGVNLSKNCNEMILKAKQKIIELPNYQEEEDK